MSVNIPSSPMVIRKRVVSALTKIRFGLSYGLYPNEWRLMSEAANGLSSSIKFNSY